MSVPYWKRGKQNFGVLTKAMDLAVHTVELCGNEKNFPKKYRWMLTQEIVKYALKIVTHIREANSINVQNQRDLGTRRALQVEAYGECEALLTLVEVAYGYLNLESLSIEHWTGMIVDVEDGISAWRKSDRERYKNIHA